MEWRQLVRSFHAVITECPIEALEAFGRVFDEPALGHRARNAYDALKAFVWRHDETRQDIVRIVGEQYRHGHIRLREAARLLETSTSDAAFVLEENGFGRSPAAISLAEQDRAGIYARLRERRLHRARHAGIDADLVERDVVASERIEGVDARAWVRRR